jgi:hypothetical protein
LAVDFRQTTETSTAAGRGVKPGLGATPAVLRRRNAVIRPKRRPRLLVIIRGEIPHRSEVGMSERPNPVVFIHGVPGRRHGIADAALTWINKQGLAAPVTVNHVA